MKSIVAVWTLFVALGIWSDEINARIIKGAQGYSKDFKTVEGIVSCNCNGMNAEFRFPVDDKVEVVLDAVAEAIENCSKCSFAQLKCGSSHNSLDSCEKTLLAELSFDNQTDDVHITSYHKDSPADMNRSRRDIDGVGACNFPRNLKTSHLSCTEYPNRIQCTQRCIFGHTLDEGISREMRCDFNENAWKPGGFQECNPFVDCSMTLVATGNKSCLVGTPDVPSVCNVTCGDYEDKVATPLTTFECQLNGGWNKPLPHCVISGSGFALVPPPNIKAHSSSVQDDHKKLKKPQKMHKPQKTDKPQKMDKTQKIDNPQKTAKPQKHIKPQEHTKLQEPTAQAAPQPKH